MNLDLFGVIDRKVNAVVKRTLNAVGEEELRTRIDSEGGSVFDGLSIFSALQAHPGAKVCSIESAAFSIASYIAMAFDTVEITSNGYMMIHNPSMSAEGEAEDMEKAKALLTKLRTSMVDAYANKTKMPRETIEAMMDKETYLNAEEALAAGFVDRIVDQSTPTRVEPTAMESMPFRVVAALGGAASKSGETMPPKETPKMAEQTAATVKAIKARYPKASAEFIVKAMEEEMAMEDIDAKMVEELTAQNEDLEETVAKLTAENEELKAKAMDDDEDPAAEGDEDPAAMDEEDPAAQGDDEEEPAARRPAARKRPGTKPVARRGSGGVRKVSARRQWEDEIERFQAKGMQRPQAVKAANKANPGLREEMQNELAANR